MGNNTKRGWIGLICRQRRWHLSWSPVAAAMTVLQGHRAHLARKGLPGPAGPTGTERRGHQ